MCMESFYCTPSPPMLNSSGITSEDTDLFHTVWKFSLWIYTFIPVFSKCVYIVVAAPPWNCPDTAVVFRFWCSATNQHRVLVSKRSPEESPHCHESPHCTGRWLANSGLLCSPKASQTLLQGMWRRSRRAKEASTRNWKRARHSLAEDNSGLATKFICQLDAIILKKKMTALDLKAKEESLLNYEGTLFEGNVILWVRLTSVLWRD